MTRYPLAALRMLAVDRTARERADLVRAMRGCASAAEARRQEVARLASVLAQLQRGSLPAELRAVDLCAASTHAIRRAEARDEALAAVRAADERLSIAKGEVADAAQRVANAERKRLALESHHRSWSARRAMRAAAALEAELDSLPRASGRR